MCSVLASDQGLDFREREGGRAYYARVDFSHPDISANMKIHSSNEAKDKSIDHWTFGGEIQFCGIKMSRYPPLFDSDKKISILNTYIM